MFDKFLKLSVIKKSKNTKSIDGNNPQLQKLLNKFDTLEQELILKGVDNTANSYIQHPLKKFDTYGASLEVDISKNLLKRRDECLVNLGKQIQYLIDNYSTQFSQLTSVYVSVNDHGKNNVATVKFKYFKTELSESDILQIFKQWKMVSTKTRAQIATERNIDSTLSDVTILISVSDETQEGDYR